MSCVPTINFLLSNVAQFEINLIINDNKDDLSYFFIRRNRIYNVREFIISHYRI